jgi:hypothetical protein
MADKITPAQLRALLKGWFKNASSTENVNRVADAAEASVEALTAYLNAQQSGIKGGIKIVVPTLDVQREVKDTLASMLLDTPGLKEMLVKQVGPSFELVGSITVVITENPKRYLCDTIATITLQPDKVVVDLSPIDAWRKTRHIITLEREAQERGESTPARSVLLPGWPRTAKPPSSVSPDCSRKIGSGTQSGARLTRALAGGRHTCPAPVMMTRFPRHATS